MNILDVDEDVLRYVSCISLHDVIETLEKVQTNNLFTVKRHAACSRIGGAYRDRTDDPLLAKQMLSQLS